MLFTGNISIALMGEKSMKMMKMFIALLTVTALTAGSAIAAGKKIVVATDATWPPMEMVDKDKKIVGFDIDFMNEVAKAAGFTVEFKNTAWDGIFAGERPVNMTQLFLR